MQEPKHQKPTFKRKTKKATCPDISSRNMNNMNVSASNQYESYPPPSSSRTFPSLEARIKNSHDQDSSVEQPVWSMSGLMAVLPESPSPICSHGSSSVPATQVCSANSETFYSQIATEFSTPRNQSFGTSCNDNNCSTCFSEIDEWLEHANKFCKSSNFETSQLRETDNLMQSGDQEGKFSMSSTCNNFLTAADHELHSITLPSITEESPVYEGQSRLACISSFYGASKSESNQGERRRLISRPKPYDAFLNEVNRQRLEAERDAWRKAKHVKLMDRMRRKETAIDDWELQQTRKVMEEMEKLQNKLERKQLQVSAKTQKKICSLKQKAEKQRQNLRRSTIEKISAASNISDTHTCSDFMWLKLGPSY